MITKHFDQSEKQNYDDDHSEKQYHHHDDYDDQVEQVPQSESGRRAFA